MENFPDTMGYPVSITLNHNQPKLELEFKTDLAPKCNASWGIDDL